MATQVCIYWRPCSLPGRLCSQARANIPSVMDMVEITRKPEPPRGAVGGRLLWGAIMRKATCDRVIPGLAGWLAGSPVVVGRIAYHNSPANKPDGVCTDQAVLGGAHPSSLFPIFPLLKHVFFLSFFTVSLPSRLKVCCALIVCLLSPSNPCHSISRTTKPRSGVAVSWDVIRLHPKSHHPATHTCLVL